jgi:Uma2 family endonuclease
VTLEEFERMVGAGVFDEDARLELIRGEIVEMAPIGLPHAVCVARLNRLLGLLVGSAALVWPQNNPLHVPGHSRPEPDLTLLRWRDDYYAAGTPTPQDVILLIEVADTSVTYDRAVKGKLYAEAGIAEYWIVNLRARVVEVYSDPASGVYRRTRSVKPGKSLRLPGGLEGAIEVEDVLGGVD